MATDAHVRAPARKAGRWGGPGCGYCVLNKVNECEGKVQTKGPGPIVALCSVVCTVLGWAGLL